MSAAVTKKKIVAQVALLAFGEETKDSDRLRALEWLAEDLEKGSEENKTMKRLDEILGEITGKEKKD